MKKVIFFILISFTFIDFSSPQELLLQGNQFFYQGKFAQARSYYEKIEHKSSFVYQNIGNCFFNEKNYAHAILAWKRAERTATLSQMIELRKNEQRVFDQCKCDIEPVYKQYIYLLFDLVSYSIMALICLSIFLLFFLSYYRYYFYNKGSKSRLFSLIFMLVFSCSLFFMKKNNINQEQAVVMKDETYLFVGPDVTFHKKRILPLGCLVKIMQKHEGMIKVDYASQTGWIQAEQIETI